jgi:hypothetical protein
VAAPTLPSDDANELTWLLFRQHNVISRRQAVRLLGPDAVKHRLASKRWVVAHRGVYLVGSAGTALVDEGQRRWIASLKRRRGQAGTARRPVRARRAGTARIRRQRRTRRPAHENATPQPADVFRDTPLRRPHQGGCALERLATVGPRAAFGCGRRAVGRP